MTTPPGMSPAEVAEYRLQRAVDRRTAATLATELSSEFAGWHERAEKIYAWLREPVIPHRLVITPGIPEMQSGITPPSEGATP